MLPWPIRASIDTLSLVSCYSTVNSACTAKTKIHIADDVVLSLHMNIFGACITQIFETKPHLHQRYRGICAIQLPISLEFISWLSVSLIQSMQINTNSNNRLLNTPCLISYYNNIYHKLYLQTILY